MAWPRFRRTGGPCYCILLQGDFAQGWKEYQWRFESTRELKALKARFRQPVWQGEDLAGRKILLYSEQGLGDTLQFIRFAPRVAQRGGHVFVECQPELKRLLQSVAGIEGIIGRDEALPDFDLCCPLSVFAPLAKVNMIHLFSLQKGPAVKQAQNPAVGIGLTDWTDKIDDLAEAAALVANLDLVISVDTAVAHLAGALGKPVWLLCRFDSEWRWLLDRADSSWYPGVRIFRQKAPANWEEVMNRVVAALTDITRLNRRS